MMSINNGNLSHVQAISWVNTRMLPFLFYWYLKFDLFYYMQPVEKVEKQHNVFMIS